MRLWFLEWVAPRRDFFVLKCAPLSMLGPNTLVFLVTISLWAVVHFIALELYLYWHYVWFDLPMHIIGGAASILGVYSFAELRVPLFAHLKAALPLFVFLIFVMVAWEVFEVWAGIPMLDNYRLDTTIDILMGFVGGIIGYVVAKRLDTL